MKNNLKHLIFSLAIVSALFIGCTKTDDDPLLPGGNNSGLFKTAGTFSFSSDKGNFTANGIFDTLFLSTNAAGAFKYVVGNRSFIMVYAYNVVSQTNMKLVFVGFADTAAMTGTGMYDFGQSGSKTGIFGYFPNLVDTSASAHFYLLTSGSLNVTGLTNTNITGTFAGNGYSAFDSTHTIAITNGSVNAPIVETYFSVEDDEELLVQEKIKAAMRKELKNW